MLGDLHQRLQQIAIFPLMDRPFMGQLRQAMIQGLKGGFCRNPLPSLFQCLLCGCKCCWRGKHYPKRESDLPLPAIAQGNRQNPNAEVVSTHRIVKKLKFFLNFTRQSTSSFSLFYFFELDIMPCSSAIIIPQIVAPASRSSSSDKAAKGESSSNKSKPITRADRIERFISPCQRDCLYPKQPGLDRPPTLARVA